MAALDRAVHDWVVAHRSPVEVASAQVVTVLGSLPGLVVLTVVVVLLVLRSRGLRQRPLVAGLVAVAVVVGYELSVVLKGVVGRPRPPLADQVGPAALDPSFPSGHALSTTVLLGLAAWLAHAVVRTGRRRHVVPALLGVAWVLVGASRVVLGYHWPSDVVGGWVVGGVLVALCRPLLRQLAVPRDEAVADGPSWVDERA